MVAFQHKRHHLLLKYHKILLKCVHVHRHMHIQSRAHTTLHQKRSEDNTQEAASSLYLVTAAGALLVLLHAGYPVLLSPELLGDSPVSASHAMVLEYSTLGLLEL